MVRFYTFGDYEYVEVSMDEFLEKDSVPIFPYLKSISVTLTKDFSKEWSYVNTSHGTFERNTFQIEIERNIIKDAFNKNLDKFNEMYKGRNIMSNLNLL